MPNLRFTDLAIKALKPGVYFDDRTPAFGIRVGARRKTWLVVKGQNRTKVRLGNYPDLPLSEARKRALVSLGSAEEVKSTLTFPEAKKLFLAQDRWRPRSKRVLTNSLNNFSWVRPLAKITHEDVATALEAISAPSSRAHALKDIRTFFNWCVPRYLPSSPAHGLKMEKQPSRDRVLTDDELKAVWVAAESMGAFGIIVRLLILLGQRCGEIGGLHGSMLSDDRVDLPPSLTKNGREHWLPLVTMAKSLMPPKSNGLLFPNANGDHFTAFAFNHRKLLNLSGTSGWTLHDLRRTFATGLAALGTPIHVTEKILNHVSGSLSGVAAIYNRFDYWDDQVAALTAWEGRVLSIVRET